MPAPKKTPTGRSVGTESRGTVSNPYAPAPGPENLEVSFGDERNLESSVPVRKYIVPAAAPRPDAGRVNGHVLTDRGWVREEGNHG